jgi:hypothetical protein
MRDGGKETEGNRQEKEIERKDEGGERAERR